MAETIGSVIAKFQSDVSEFKKGLGETRDQVSGFKTGLEGVGGVAMKLAAIVGVAFTADAMVKAFKDVVTAAGEAQVQMSRVDALIRSTGLNFDSTRKAVDEVSKSFIQLGFDDEDTATAMAKSLAVTKDVTSSRKELGLAADFARLQDISIIDAQKLLQLAYMGNARVLKQYGIELEDGATKQEIFNKIQAVAGGQAQAYSDTYVGSMARLQVQWQNLKETLGEIFLPGAVDAISKVSEFVNKIQEWMTAGDGLNQTVGNLKTIWLDFMTTIAPAVEWFRTTIVPPLQAIWAEFVYFMNQVIPPVAEAVRVFIFVLLIPFLTYFVNYWKARWDEISTILIGAWELIKGIVQVAFAIIAGIFTTMLALMQGDWSKAWDNIKHYAEIAWEGIKNILRGVYDFLFGWGELVLHNLVSPFEEAWNKIKEKMENIRNAIKDALDFNQRHSPSIMDIVNQGIGQVQNALGTIGIEPLAHNLEVSGNNGGQQITINLPGAIISSPDVAEQYAEIIGDKLIDRLGKVRRI
jgi:hypothetical protein